MAEKKFLSLDGLSSYTEKIKTLLNNLTDSLSIKADASHSHTIADIEDLQSSLSTKVSNTRTINDKPLSENITLTHEDVGADPVGSASQVLTESKAYTDQEVAALVNGAPETLDTLDELAAALKDNADIADVITDAIGLKADASALTSHTEDTNNPHSVTAEQINALPLTGGTMDSGAQIVRDGNGNYFVYGRDGALVKTTSVDLASGFNPVMSAKTGDGSWDIGTYTDNILHFNYITDENYDADENIQTANIYFDSNGSITANNFYGHATSATNTYTLDGHAPSSDPTGSTIALRDPNGYLYASYLNQSSNAETPTGSSMLMYANEDGFLRKSTLEDVKGVLGLGKTVPHDAVFTDTQYGFSYDETDCSLTFAATGVTGIDNGDEVNY